MKMAEDGQKWENKEAVDGDFRQKLLVIKLLFALFLSFSVCVRVRACVFVCDSVTMPRCSCMCVGAHLSV